MKGPMEGLGCIEGLEGTSEQLSAAIHLRMAGLPQGQEQGHVFVAF